MSNGHRIDPATQLPYPILQYEQFSGMPVIVPPVAGASITSPIGIHGPGTSNVASQQPGQTGGLPVVSPRTEEGRKELYRRAAELGHTSEERGDTPVERVFQDILPPEIRQGFQESGEFIVGMIPEYIRSIPGAFVEWFVTLPQQGYRLFQLWASGEQVTMLDVMEAVEPGIQERMQFTPEMVEHYSQPSTYADATLSLIMGGYAYGAIHLAVKGGPLVWRSLGKFAMPAALVWMRLGLVEDDRETNRLLRKLLRRLKADADEREEVLNQVPPEYVEEVTAMIVSEGEPMYEGVDPTSEGLSEADKQALRYSLSRIPQDLEPGQEHREHIRHKISSDSDYPTMFPASSVGREIGGGGSEEPTACENQVMEWVSAHGGWEVTPQFEEECMKVYFDMRAQAVSPAGLDTPGSTRVRRTGKSDKSIKGRPHAK